MKKIINAIVILLFIFVERSNAHGSYHVQNIIIQYQVSLYDLKSEIETFNRHPVKKKNNLKILILALQKLQKQKFNIDSHFIEYEFLNKRILLDNNIQKKRSKRKTNYSNGTKIVITKKVIAFRIRFQSFSTI
jgi:hypothetical protein